MHFQVASVGNCAHLICGTISVLSLPKPEVSFLRLLTIGTSQSLFVWSTQSLAQGRSPISNPSCTKSPPLREAWWQGIDVAQGRSPIFIDRHWLRGVPPCLSTVIVARMYGSVASWPSGWGWPASGWLALLDGPPQFQVLSAGIFRILTLAHLEGVRDRGQPAFVGVGNAL